MEIMTLKEAAAYLKCGEEHLRQMAKKSLVPHRRIGLGEHKPRYRFLKEKLDEWLCLDLPFVNPLDMQEAKFKLIAQGDR